MAFCCRQDALIIQTIEKKITIFGKVNFITTLRPQVIETNLLYFTVPHHVVCVEIQVCVE